MKAKKESGKFSKNGREVSDMPGRQSLEIGLGQGGFGGGPHRMYMPPQAAGGGEKRSKYIRIPKTNITISKKVLRIIFLTAGVLFLCIVLIVNAKNYFSEETPEEQFDKMAEEEFASGRWKYKEDGAYSESEVMAVGAPCNSYIHIPVQYEDAVNEVTEFFEQMGAEVKIEESQENNVWHKYREENTNYCKLAEFRPDTEEIGSLTVEADTVSGELHRIYAAVYDKETAEKVMVMMAQTAGAEPLNQDMLEQCMDTGESGYAYTDIGKLQISVGLSSAPEQDGKEYYDIIVSGLR